MDDLISRETMKDVIDSTTWYHQNRNGVMVEGASDEETAWFKAKDVFKAIENVPSAQAELSQVARDIATIIENEKDMRVIASAQPELIRCKDCIYGYLYMDVQNGIIDSWFECRNPEGLNRDVSVDGYCSASIRRT